MKYIIEDFIVKSTLQVGITDRWGQDIGSNSEFDKTKFAKLIINECCNISKKFVQDELNLEKSENLAKLINNRFGV